MKTLLVAVDGSEISLKGARMAVTLAQAMNATVELVYVVHPVLLPPSVYAETIQRLEEGNQALAKDVLGRAAAVVREAGGTSESVMVHGSPAEAIADLSQAERVWGIVIGAKGHNALSRVMLGSTTDRLMHLSTKPVLVVR
jgi:nucleotide-binding universal stress UspA family protein